MKKRWLVGCLSAFCLFWFFGCKPKPKTTTPAEQQKDKSATTDRTEEAAPPNATESDPYVAPLLTSSRTLEVDVLWVRNMPIKKNKSATAKGKSTNRRKPLRKRRSKTKKGKGKPKYKKKGGVTRVRLTVLPNPRRKACIGFTEQFPGGAGGMWQASLWIAARAASQAAGRQLVDFRFLAGSEGFIDGPSAGALFTAGFMAAITGAKVRPDVSMTGAVNPDGTVGLVGGLEQKFLAALRKGKKVLGYPEGNKLQEGKNGRVVNLEILAEENGAKAVPIRDIYEAYTLLTGKEFPGRKKAAIKDMSFSKEAREKLLQLASAWLARHVKLLSEAESKQFDKGVKTLYASRLKPSVLYKQLAKKTRLKKKLGAAYYSAVRSATWAYTAEKFTDVIYLWQQWIKLVKKESKKARARFIELLKKRRAALKKSAQKRGCEKKEWKGSDCRKLKRKLRRQKQLRKRAERKKKSNRRKGRRSRKPGRAGDRSRKNTGSAKKTQEEKLPPEPPKDFHKILVELAEEMTKKTKGVEATKKELAQIEPGSVDRALALVAGYAELLQGSAFALIAKKRLLRLKKYRKFIKYMRARRAKLKHRAMNSYNVLTELRRSRMRRQIAYRTGQYVDETVKFAGIAFGKSTLAKELAGLYSAGGQPVRLNEENMKSIANQLFAAAKANLDLIRSVFKRHRHGTLVLAILSSRNPEYIIARLGASQAGKMVLEFRQAEDLGEHIELGTGYAALGAAVAAYMASAKIIGKWFNLRVKHRTGQKVKSVGRPVTLTNALHRARIFALEAAYRAKKVAGGVPTFSRILFQTADVMKRESLSGQVKSLELYWRAALYCRLAEMFARPPGNEAIGQADLPAPVKETNATFVRMVGLR
jgi:hypothetical protein